VYKNILVPIDGSNTAQRGLNEAVGLAKTLGSRIRLVHAINDAELISPYASGTNYEDLFDQVERHGTALLQEAEAAVRAAGVAVDTKLLEANGVVVGEQVLQAAANWAADLIVCGTHGRRGLRRIVMGSDAEYIVRQSPVPVLLVRAADGAV